ncbi:MAG: hypothetical protein ACJAVW_003021, partial [Spirosomataceae bacterium]
LSANSILKSTIIQSVDNLVFISANRCEVLDKRQEIQ